MIGISTSAYTEGLPGLTPISMTGSLIGIM